MPPIRKEYYCKVNNVVTHCQESWKSKIIRNIKISLVFSSSTNKFLLINLSFCPYKIISKQNDNYPLACLIPFFLEMVLILKLYTLSM